MSVRPSGDEIGDATGAKTGDDAGDATGAKTGDATGDEAGGAGTAGDGGDAGGAAGGRTLPRMIASAPWVVALVGIAVLAVLLVVALLSFRGPERPTAREPGPPMLLPTHATTDGSAQPGGPATAPATSSASATPTRPATPTESVPPTGSAPPTASSARPADTSAGLAPSHASGSPSAPAQAPPAGQTGAVSASYRVQDSGDAESFQAQLVVRNGTDRSSDWQVELRFGGGVTGVRASSGPGVSVTIRGSGWYLLSGTGQLGAGAQQSVHLRFTRTGGGEYPAQCTVNGATCGIG
ncbi:hypothetical protein [Micromonospora sp. WMMD1082]|uniref:hypothetical protein n=1 Tax=Micromonospora sp. WMMD1082 TaxID=3016104 RepID=UPI002416B61D|nr:hypothetical protein [Micromonospora sp. WMMD1082]MDG4796750.1 hypothetical protein [Micromonospora sp. WMMD1082]